jgi:hypothetical protein
MVDGARCAVREMPMSVIQSLANQPMDVQVELISGRGGDVFLNQADPADTARLIEQNRQELIVNANGRKHRHSMRRPTPCMLRIDGNVIVHRYQGETIALTIGAH